MPDPRSRRGTRLLARALARALATAIAAALGVTAVSTCATRNYTYYLIDPEPQQHQTLEAQDNMQRPFAFGTSTVMRVSWNDGDVLTQVDVPMLSSGQRIVVEHARAGAGVQTIPATRLVAPPPTPADKSLVEAYRARGLRVDESAPDVSVVRARERVQEALKDGNFSVALEWVELVLARFPSHPEFLRAKASILLMMGEKAKAIEIYEKAESVESDPAVRRKLDELQSTSP